MDQALAWGSLISQGLRTNFWGLGCPLHCQSFPLSSFLLVALLGWLLGILSLAAFLGLIPWPGLGLSDLSRPSSAPSRSSSERLALYLHERGLRGRGGH